MTAVAVVPSVRARSVTRPQSSSEMRRDRPGVFGWLGTTVDLGRCEPCLEVEDRGATGVVGLCPCAACVDGDACLLVGGGLCDYGVYVDALGFVGGACLGGDGGDGVCAHGSTLAGVIHPCKRETEKLQ